MTRFLIFLLILSPVISFADSTCAEWQARYLTLSLSSTPLTETIWKDQNIAAVEVVFLGEHHLHRLQGFYSGVLSTFRKISPAFDCLFIEEDRNSSLDEADPRMKVKYLEALKLDYLPFFVDQFEKKPDWILSTPDLTKLRNSDHEKYLTYVHKFNAWINETAYRRNRAVAQRMVELLRGRQCHKAIAIYGKWHVDDESENPGTDTLPHLLSKADIPYRAYDIDEPLSTLANHEDFGDPNSNEQIIKESTALADRCVQTGQQPLWIKPLFVPQMNSVWNGYLFVPNEN